MKHSVKIIPMRRKDKQGIFVTHKVPLFADIHFQHTRLDKVTKEPKKADRLFYFTGYRIDLDKWNVDKDEVKRGAKGYEGKRVVDYLEINNRLKLITSTLGLYLPQKREATQEEVIELLNGICNKSEKDRKKEKIKETPEAKNLDFFEVFQKYYEECGLSQGRTRHVRSLINHWKHYCEKRKFKPTFDNVTGSILKDFERYLSSESVSQKGRNREAIVIPKGKNTIHEIMAKTRAFWNYARKELKQQGITIPYPFEDYEFPKEAYGKPVYITLEERNKLYEAKLTNPKLALVRDIFCFQCFVGARVGDLKKLNRASIHKGVISYIPRKTKDENPVLVTVPLHEKAIEILNRYNMPNGALFPFLQDTEYNDFLKMLFRVVGLNRIVTRLNTTTGEPEQVPLSSIASSHMARRTFVGGLYGKVDRGIISSMTGHVKGSKAFDRYYDVSDELQKGAINLLD